MKQFRMIPNTSHTVFAPLRTEAGGKLRDIRIPRKRNACVWDSFPAIPDAPFHPILIEHFCIQHSLPCMEQTISNPSACRLHGPFATNTSMDFGVLLLRLGVAVMMLVHGIPKLGMLISGNWSAFQDPLGIGNFLSLLLCVGAEFGCSILILLGFLTRLASLILVINMCEALYLVLGLSGWGAQELAAIYLLIYLTLFYTGPGKFSLDAWWLWRDCRIEVE